MDVDKFKEIMQRRQECRNIERQLQVTVPPEKPSAAMKWHMNHKPFTNQEVEKEHEDTVD